MSALPELLALIPRGGRVNLVSTVALDHDRAVTIAPTCEDEAIAARCDAPLLITAASPEAVEALARRVHAASGRKSFPFIAARARVLPIDAGMPSNTCVNLIRAASGGTLLLTGVEDLPAIAQDRLLDVLAESQSPRPPAPVVRLITGTTVSLFDRVAGGAFSEELFYRLNVIHLMARDGRLIARG